MAITYINKTFNYLNETSKQIKIVDRQLIKLKNVPPLNYSDIEKYIEHNQSSKERNTFAKKFRLRKPSPARFRTPLTKQPARRLCNRFA